MSKAMNTDLYEVTMALAYLNEGMTAPATFSLFVRDLPPERGFLVAAGLEQGLDYLEHLQINDADTAAFATALRVPGSDVAPLYGLHFTGDVYAVPEGRIVFAGEPLLEVTAPLPEAQFVETYLLNQMSYSTALASKAARCVIAARGREVVDFSLRRTHGVEAGTQAARVGAIVGFKGTSNVAAATIYGLPAVGTMAHSFVEAFDSEGDAFDTFARNTSGPVTLLVDTYDTARGVSIAIDVLSGLSGHRRYGIRLDSGDLRRLAGQARKALDAAGLKSARIVVSGGLDEYDIDTLVAAHGPVDVFAVGTKVGTSADQPYLDSAYKLVAYAGRPVMKLSTGKVTAPGPKQVFRRSGLMDVITTRDDAPTDDCELLLQPVMRAGKRTATAATPRDEVKSARRRFQADLAALPSPARRIREPIPHRPHPSIALNALTRHVQGDLEQREPRDRRDLPVGREHPSQPSITQYR